MIRSKTVGQSLDAQIEVLREAGCERIYKEKVTGTSTAPRTQLTAMLEQVRPGDMVVVTKIDRLARSIIDLNKIVSELSGLGVSVQFLKDNIVFTSGENASSINALLFNILGSFAQFERDIIVERTSEGRERAKAAGKHMGRVGQPEKNVRQVLDLLRNRSTNGMSVADIVKLSGVPKPTIYAKIKAEAASE